MDIGSSHIATATTANLESIRKAATSGSDEKPNRATVHLQRNILERLWILDSISPGFPPRNYFSQLAQPEKHHLVDPALATILLSSGREALLQGKDTTSLQNLLRLALCQSPQKFPKKISWKYLHN